MILNWNAWGSRADDMQGIPTKNILIISEFFVGGGLETQLCGQARYLQERGYKVYLLTSSSRSGLAESVFDSTYFDVPMATATAFQLLKTIDLLGEIVEKKAVSVIHCHPFYSIVPAMFVAHRYGLPLISTIHGPASLSAERDTILGMFLFDLLLPRASLLLSVSLETSVGAKKVSPCNPLLLPNAVKFPTDEPSSLDLRQPWLWAGRLDDLKTTGLLALVNEFGKHKHNVLHIYGAGPKEESVKAVLQELDPFSKWVQYKGWKNNISDIIENYSVVCGMGRVVLEGASLNRPCMLVGYDGIKGLVSQDNLDFSESFNFSGRGMENISSDIFSEQLEDLNGYSEKYLLSEEIKRNHMESKVWARYEKLVDSISTFSCAVLEDFGDLLWLNSRETEVVWSNSHVYSGFKSLLQNAKEPI